MKINRLLIFGGNGFVGQAIAKRALQNGLKVVALSRNGLPHDIQHDLDKTPNFKENVCAVLWVVNRFALHLHLHLHLHLLLLRLH